MEETEIYYHLKTIVELIHTNDATLMWKLLSAQHGRTIWCLGHKLSICKNYEMNYLLRSRRKYSKTIFKKVLFYWWLVKIRTFDLVYLIPIFICIEGRLHKWFLARTTHFWFQSRITINIPILMRCYHGQFKWR